MAGARGCFNCGGCASCFRCVVSPIPLSTSLCYDEFRHSLYSICVHLTLLLSFTRPSIAWLDECGVVLTDTTLYFCMYGTCRYPQRAQSNIFLHFSLLGWMCWGRACVRYFLLAVKLFWKFSKSMMSSRSSGCQLS
jgi:hypothetical protein